MSDPLRHKASNKVASSDISALKFAKLHSPKMKSVYWPYFGFPTNEQDRIITKQNVVCTICHKVLTNHGNTTNLRAHLQHRHKDVFNKVCTENGIKVPPRRNAQPRAFAVKRETIERKVKLEYNETPLTPNTESIAPEDQAMLYETMVPMTYDDDEIIDSDHFVKVEVSGGASDSNRKSSGSSKVGAVCSTSVDTKSGYRVDVIEEMEPYQLQDALVNMIIQDMRNVDTLYEPGMSQFIRGLCGNVLIPSEEKVEGLLKEMHSHKLTTLADQIKVHSQVKPFSLGFEIWSNIEQKHFLSIYYNYTTEAPDYNLLNKQYCTFEYNKFTSCDTIFEEFNLENCTAAIVSWDYDDYLKHFLRNKNIPIILAYDVTVDKCLRNLFALPAVVSIIEEVKEVIMRYTSEINSKDVEIPSINDDFPWTYYDMLKFFSESVSWPEELDVLVNSAKTITDTLNTLALTLDTLKGEEIPHSSMLSPITTKILNKKLNVTDEDDEFAGNMKSTIAAELQKLVISDDHLTLAALLDPRFHRLTNINNLGNCVQILKNKYNRICEMEGYATAEDKDAAVKTSQSSTAKKSNLELFFDIQEVSTSEPVRQEKNVESDLNRYRNEVYASLDDSPFSWWNKMGHMYGSLKKLACLYQCVPCVVNMNFKKPVKQQICERQKRYMLSGNLVDAIMFLYHNGKNI